MLEEEPCGFFEPLRRGDGDLPDVLASEDWPAPALALEDLNFGGIIATTTQKTTGKVK